MRASGLPRPFFSLAATEFSLRFSLAGVKSILTLVLIDHVLADGLPGSVGADGLQRMLESLFGPLSAAGLASQIYGITTALLYLSVPVGGFLGDRLTRRSGSIYLGGLCILAGLALMTGRLLFLPGLALFAVGTGIVKGNLSVVVGALFADGAARRRGYAIYLGFLNGGIAIGPLVCGALLLAGGWGYACGAAATAVGLGLLSWHLAGRHLARLEAAPARDPRPAGDDTARGDWPLLLTALLAIYLCFAAYEQVGNLFLVWARARVTLEVAGWPLPVSWLLALDGVFTILLIPVVQFGLRRLARFRFATGPIWEIALGCVACACGNGVLAVAEATSGGAPLPLAAALGYLICIDLAIVLVWPAGLSLVTGSAPARAVGFWVGMFYLHGFFASLWVGPIGAWYGRIPAAQFWLLHAAVALAGAVLLLPLGLARARRRSQATTTSACANACA
ncbi:amino acid transporter [Sphingomonas psychrotolerans]|uniref:Amino acid transporter n=2 Tax=Sphingomonas psychrotolerans TaxID=1327635 RepID=A0A2K8MLN0_9SPHN|nr:amino acid transporter [Sphingomonas psychrotolerans]